MAIMTVFPSIISFLPALLLRGLNDPTSTRADAEGLLSRLGASRASQVTVEPGTHFVSADVHPPTAFAAFLMQFGWFIVSPGRGICRAVVRPGWRSADYTSEKPLYARVAPELCACTIS